MVETMLACWLAISPMVFYRAEAPAALWWFDLSTAALVAVLALVSYWPPTRYAHLGIIPVGLVLLAAGWLAAYPPSPSDQNHVAVGLLLLLFAIVPNEANDPPAGWREFEKQRGEAGSRTE